jgi:hypothetical protein
MKTSSIPKEGVFLLCAQYCSMGEIYLKTLPEQQRCKKARKSHIRLASFRDGFSKDKTYE